MQHTAQCNITHLVDQKLHVQHRLLGVVLEEEVDARLAEQPDAAVAGADGHQPLHRVEVHALGVVGEAVAHNLQVNNTGDWVRELDGFWFMENCLLLNRVFGKC